MNVIKKHKQKMKHKNNDAKYNQTLKNNTSVINMAKLDFRLLTPIQPHTINLGPIKGKII